MKFSFAPILFLVVSFYSYSQSYEEITSLNPSFQDYVPQSPDVSAINKFVDIPVSEATGIPQITIPVYSYSNENNGLQLNVSLDYHNGGVKVNEVASRAGLSWALNAGGVISRMRRGTHDELSGFGFLEQDDLPQELEGNSPVSVDMRPFNRMYANVMDSQPDIFTYSFGGQSGKFIFGKNGDLLLLDQSNLKIEKTIGSVPGPYSSQDFINSFTITDDSGFKYYFTAPEITQTLPVNVNDEYTSAWYLTRIVSPKDNLSKIEFEYENENLTNYTSSYSNTRYRRTDGYGGELTAPTSSSSVDIYSKRLKKIALPNGVDIDFNYESGSSTVGGGRPLKEIVISDGENTRGFLLDRDYSLNRQTLKKISLYKGTVTNIDGAYEFEYVGVLPSRGTVPDHWGFYRGSNGSDFPREVFNSGLVGGIFELPGGSRDTDSTYVKYGSLKKMTYPTGGFTIFDMEANTSDDPRIKQDFTISQPGPDYDTEYFNGLVVDSDLSFGANNIDYLYQGVQGQGVTFKFTSSTGSSVINPNYPNPKIVIELHSSDNYYTAPLGRAEIVITSNGYDMLPGSFAVSNLTPGHYYKLLFYVENLNNYYSYLNGQVEVPNGGTTVEKRYKHIQDFVGGIRAKNIKFYDKAEDAPKLIKHYSYVLEDGITSSGTLGVIPKYSHTTIFENITWEDGAYHSPTVPPWPFPIYNSVDNVIIRESSPLLDLSTVMGSPVIYKRVEVQNLDSLGNNLGKEVTYFTNFEDSPPYLGLSYPYIPTQLDEWKYGLLQKREFFDKNDVPVKEIVNDYKYSQDLYFKNPRRIENFRGISIAPVRFFDPWYAANAFEVPPLGRPDYFIFNSFTPSAGRADLSRTVETTYFNGNSLRVEKNYSYDPLYHKLKEVSIIQSEGDLIIKNYNYPFDLLDGESVNGTNHWLVNNHELNTVINEETSIADLDMSNKKSLHFVFNNYGPQFGRPRVATINSGKAGDLPVPRIYYHSYDTYGNPLEVSKADGPRICYIWGYNGQYPVAKIENAKYDQIEDLSGFGENFDLGGGGLSSSQKLTLRNALPEAMVTTYEYEPLVGVTKITDPRGQTMTYEYDDFNRLKAVLDDDLKMLQEYKYHYKNQ